MRRLTRGLLLSAAVLVTGGAAAGCGGSGSGPIASFSTTRTAAAQPSRSVTAQPSAPAGGLPSQTATAQPPQTTPAQPTRTVTAQAPAPAATPSSSGSTVIWPWILLGVIVIIVIIGIVLLVRRSSGRKSTAASWRTQVIDAYAKGAALYDAMSVAETPGALAAADAQARWSDIQRRADDLAQTLYALREVAVDEDERALVADTLASLQVIRSAMDAERAPAGAGPGQAAIVSSRLASFEASLRALRAAGDPQ
jgi:hypothetical protein